MDKYYIIKKDKQSEYNKMSPGFFDFPCRLIEKHKGSEFYNHWRLGSGTQDTLIVTKIKIEDLEEVKVI